MNVEFLHETKYSVSIIGYMITAWETLKCWVSFNHGIACLDITNYKNMKIYFLCRKLISENHPYQEKSITKITKCWGMISLCTSYIRFFINACVCVLVVYVAKLQLILAENARYSMCTESSKKQNA